MDGVAIRASLLQCSLLVAVSLQIVTNRRGVSQLSGSVHTNEHAAAGIWLML